MKNRGIIFNKKYLILIFGLYLTIIFGIVFSEAFNPYIFGHDSSEINGLTWPNGVVGRITFNSTPLQGSHSTSEIENIVWFDNGGIFLKGDSFAQAVSYFAILNSTKGIATSIEATLTSEIDQQNLSRACYRFDVKWKKNQTAPVVSSSSGVSCYPNNLNLPASMVNFTLKYSTATYNVSYDSPIARMDYKNQGYIKFTTLIRSQNNYLHYMQDSYSTWRKK